MSTNSFKIKKSLVVDPQAGSVVSEKGELAYNVATDKYEGYTSSADPIVQEAKTSTLTNKNLGNSNNTLSGATAATLVSGAGTLTLNTSGTATVPNATDTLVGKDTTDILTNKTIGNALTVTQIATPSNPSAGLNKIYTKADGSLYNLNSSGIETQIGSGGGGVKNYLGTVNNVNGNGNFELGATTGFGLFNTTLTSLIPTGAIVATAASITTFATTSVNKLAGNFSLNVASSGVLAAGQGFISTAFTLDREDRSKVLTIRANYSVESGTVVQSANSGNTFAVYAYDVTNSAWIQPAGVYSMDGSGVISSNFQPPSTCTSLRLAVLCINATAGAVSLLFDDITVSPQSSGAGNVKAPTLQKFLSGSGTYTTPSSPAPQYIRVRMVGGGGGGAGGGTSAVTGTAGNSSTFGALTANGGLAGSSSGGAGGSGTIGSGWIGSIHPGNGGSGGNNVILLTYTLGGVGGGSAIFGGGGLGASTSAGGAGVTNSGGGGGGAGTTSGNNVGGGGGGGGGGVQALTSAAPAATYSYTVGASSDGGAGSQTTGAASGSGYIEVTEFYAPVSAASEGDGRVVAASVANTAGTSIPTNTDTAVPYATTTYDTHSAFSGSSFTAPVSGYYRLTTTQTWDSANFLNVVLDLMFKKNGSTVVARTLLYPQTSTGLSWSQTLSQTIKLNAGEYAGVYVAQGSGGSRTLLTGTGTNVFAVEQVQGPSNISSVETVAARSNATPTSSAFNNTAYLIFSAVSYDTHAEYSTSTGLYTTPISGIYNFGGQFGMSGGSVGGYLEIVVYVNGSSAYNFIPATLATGEQFIPLNLDIKLNAGDTVGFRWNTDKSSPAVSGGTTKNTLSLHRVGN